MTDPAPTDAPRPAGSEPAGSEPAVSRSGASEPTFSEQLAEQLGGVRGLIESSIPVVVFVIINVVWSLNPALIASVVVAAVIVAFRLSRRQPVRHAINGVFGVAVGAAIAWRTGEARNFYLPGIVLSFAYGGLLLLSAVVRHPAVGYVWAVIAAGGRQVWRTQPRLLWTFQWLTLLWATMYLAKGVVRTVLYQAQEATWLGIVYLATGYPPYLLLLGVTVWAVRRVTHSEQQHAAEVTT